MDTKLTEWEEMRQIVQNAEGDNVGYLTNLGRYDCILRILKKLLKNVEEASKLLSSLCLIKSKTFKVIFPIVL